MFLLRTIELTDVKNIFAYAKNPNVCNSQNYIKDYIFNYYSKGVPEPLGITLKENPTKVVGTVGCFWTSQQAKAMELAYAIGEEHWGKGFVSEGSQAVMSVQ